MAATTSATSGGSWTRGCPKDAFATLVEAITQVGCIPMATPFDEKSVDWCVEFDMPIIKIASADFNDWMLMEKIATTRKPVIVSIGGTSAEGHGRRGDILRATATSRWPSTTASPRIRTRTASSELNQIDFLRRSIPGTHDRLLEPRVHGLDSLDRHRLRQGRADIRAAHRHRTATDSVSPYCSLPEQIDTWFKRFTRRTEMCGRPGPVGEIPLQKETNTWTYWSGASTRSRDLVRAIR